MNAIVIGAGEVGKALVKVVSTAHRVYTYDAAWGEPNIIKDPIDVMHVAFPCDSQEAFVGHVQRYQANYRPRATVIHSTVHLGTTEAVGGETYYSPVRGVHPHLAESMTAFWTYLGGNPPEWLAGYFLDAGFRVQTHTSAADLEAAKLWSLAQYAASIMVEKEIHRYCKEHGLDFSVVYSDWNTTYNAGFQVMGKAEVTRPVLRHMDGPIGGHCVVPALEKLDEQSNLAAMLLDMNFRLQLDGVCSGL